jgi:glycosyltransferase involved in cell wall biosynthesis
MVTHLIQSFAIGGLENMVLQLSEETQRAGFGVHVIAYLEDGPLREEMNRRGISTSLLKEGDGLAPRLPFKIGRQLAAVNAGILHTHHLGPYTYGALAALMLRIPHVHTDHSHEFYDRRRRRFLGRSMNRLATVVSVSEEVEDYRQTHLGVSGRVIANGVPIPEEKGNRELACRRAGLDPKKRYLGCVARLAEEKDPCLLVRAFFEMVTNSGLHDVDLVFIGDGPSRERVKDQIEMCGLSQRVHLLGSRSDVPYLLPLFDLFVLPSKREGLSLALLEAMAAGIPFVCTNVGDHGRVAKCGGGIVVESGDATGLYMAMGYLLAAHDQRRLMGAAARAWVEDHAGVRGMAEQYLDLYRQTLRQS